MQIGADRLFFPRNFLFFHRLPARFEIGVIARGATIPRGTVFELEVFGQRLALPSKTELKVGARYELEKISAMEFRIVREVGEEKPASAPVETVKTERRPESFADGLAAFAQLPSASYSDLLALRVSDDGHNIKKTGEHKYAFDLSADFPFKGVFIEREPGSYTLFVSGAAATLSATNALAAMLADFGVSAVRPVSADVLERISAGAIDMQT
ncbi:MAG: hypothetical protein JNJ69_00230 [Leptospiraceae bacterium]|nr:hypothetical protein [Leptospiraceae bacterium]